MTTNVCSSCQWLLPNHSDDCPVVKAAGRSGESSGGDNDYWVATVTNPKRLEPYQAECEDLIELFQMTFQEGEAFKALWRKGQLRIGNGKPGDTLLRNSEKAYHYSGRMVAMEKGSKT